MSVIKAGTTLTTAYTVEADTTGALEFKTGPSATLAMSISASGVVTFPATTGFDIASANITNLTSGTTSATVLRSASGTITNLLATTATVSASAFFATASGNVGIGTSSPSAKFDVYSIRTSSTNVTAMVLSDNVTGAQTNGVYKSIRSISNGSASVSEIRFLETDGTNNNTSIAFATQPTAGGLTERLRINQAGNVGIGTNDPTHRLDIREDSTSTTVMSGVRINNQSFNSNTQTGIGFYAADNYNAKVYTIRTGTSNGNLIFGTNGGGGIAESNVIERARFNNTGAFVFAGGTTTADGIGITFPATQSASSNANTLDDYEEGNWTPRLTGTGGGDYTPAGVNNGRYIKIGKMVWATATLQWSAQVTAYSGNLAVSGLPFTSTNNRAIGSMGAVLSGLTFTAGYGEWVYLIDPGYTFVYIIQNSTTGAGYSHNPTVATSGLVYCLSIVYEAS